MADERAGGGSTRLPWPPLPDDLRRLYLEERLSACKIAKAYGLEYASEKTAESTILYHLKKNGIARRDASAHVRKVTTKMVDEWVVRYQAGESLKQIAGDSVGPVTVFNHLRKRGIQLRDKVEAQIKAVSIHDKKPFDGDLRALAYIVGYAKGDLATTKHGRAIRVKMSTTHPEMADLFRELFAEHGPIYEYPKESPLTGFEWNLDCDLDHSFEFLLNVEPLAREFIERADLFLSFLAGFFDADGSVYCHKKRARGAFEFSLTNADGELLGRIQRRLTALGFSPTLRLDRQSPQRGVKNGGDFIWRLKMWRYEDVARVLNELPMRHSEKRAKAAIALRLASKPTRADRSAVVRDWDLLRERIISKRDDYVRKASLSFAQRRTSGD